MALIQPADIRDLVAVQRLERACFGPDAWGWLEVAVALLTPSIRLKAVLAGRLIGFAVGERHTRDQEGWVATLGVHPDYQRRGVGRQLLQAVEAQLPFPRLKLTVRASNTPAIALYEQFGYRPLSRIARYYPSGEDGIVMERRPPPPAGA
ncbi:MAG: GNAT family N-acetyltransferase [Anaerolineales bacterium]|nr:GNAT family N-acetyltransferase [Anaerolineales bacterium]